MFTIFTRYLGTVLNSPLLYGELRNYDLFILSLGFRCSYDVLKSNKQEPCIGKTESIFTCYSRFLALSRKVRPNPLQSLLILIYLKYWIGILFLTILIDNIYGQTQSQVVHFESSIDIESVYQKVIQEDKYVFLYFSADWCAPCKWMEKNTFQDDLIIYWLNELFIPIKVDVETTSGKLIKQQFSIHEVPGIIILDKEKNPIRRLNRSVSPEMLKEVIRSLNEKETQQNQVDQLVSPAYELNTISRPALQPETIPYADSIHYPQSIAQNKSTHSIVPRSPSSQTFELKIGNFQTYEAAISMIRKIEKAIPIKVSINASPNGPKMSYLLKLDKITSSTLAKEYQTKLNSIGIKTILEFSKS